MVCKEDVLLWFKDLDGYKRIDVMHALLNMCVPFEVRFLGSCIEEIGKHSYQELRGPAIISNDIDKLNKDSSLTHGLLEQSVRHRVMIYLSLLSSRNCKCANWFYKTLFRTELVESLIVKGTYKDENLQNELLLLFTMAVNHPAFTFEQKTFFGSMLAHLIDQKDSRKHISAKPYPGYPPGFGYPITQKMHPDIPYVPVKCASSMCHVDTTPHQHPSGFISPHPVTGPVELLPMWHSRPGFAGSISGAPEVAPFPPQSISPLVSQPTSPTPSRAASPHRTYPIRPGPGLQPPNQPLEMLPPAPSIPLDPLTQPSLQFATELSNADDDLNHIPEDKSREAPWINPVVIPMDIKHMNGFRFPPTYNKGHHQYFIDQMQILNLEGESSLHCSSSSSSSNNSSLNQSPSETPTVTPSVTPHGPGRGDNKLRVNGVPPFINPGPPTMNTGPPICETTPPPPPPPALSNCSVPYSNYPPPHVSLTAIPNSTPPQVPPRNANCYNCGASGHIGADCSSQTIEEITQKKAYTLEFSSPMPDTDK